jgi:DNA-directed RNA polymerase subunit RPC12/RpoP
MPEQKIELKSDEEISVKRFYLSHTIEVDCPKCQSKVELLGDKYVSYPKLNTSIDTYSCCNECGKEFTLPIKIGMSLEYDLDKLVVED